MSTITGNFLSQNVYFKGEMTKARQQNNGPSAAQSAFSTPSFAPVNSFKMGQALKSTALAKTVTFRGTAAVLQNVMEKKNYGPRIGLTKILQNIMENPEFIKNNAISHKIEVGNKAVKELILDVTKVVEGEKEFIKALVKKDNGNKAAEILITPSKLKGLKDDIGIMAFNDKAGNVLVSLRNEERVAIGMPGADIADKAKDIKIHIPGKKAEPFEAKSFDIENVKKLDLSNIKAFSASDKPYTGPNINIVVKDGNAAEAHLVTLLDFFNNPEKAKLVHQITESRKGGKTVSPEDQKKITEMLKDFQVEILSGGLGSRSGADERTLKAGKFTATSKALTQQPNGLSPIENVLVNMIMSGVDLNGAKVGEHIRISIEPKGNGENLRSISSAYFNKFIDPKKPNLILPNDGQIAISEQGFENVYVKALSKMKDENLAGVIVLKKQTLDEVAGKMGVVEFDEKTGIAKRLGEKLSLEELAKPENAGFKVTNDADGKNYVTSIFNTVVGEEVNNAKEILVPFINKDGKADLNGRIIGPLCVISTKETPAEMKAASELLKDVPDETLMDIKNNVLKGKKIAVVDVKENWGDCGDIMDNYKMQHEIAKGEFMMSPFENQKTLESMNPKTGVIAEDSELLGKFQNEFEDANGNIMVFRPTAEPSKEVAEKADAIFATSYKSTNNEAHAKYDAVANPAASKEDKKKLSTGKVVAGVAVGAGAIGTGAYFINKNQQKKATTDPHKKPEVK